MVQMFRQKYLKITASLFFSVIATLLFCHPSFSASLSDIEAAIIEKDYERARNLCGEFLAQSSQEGQKKKVKYYLGLSVLFLGDYVHARGIFKGLLDVHLNDELFDKVSIGIVDTYLLNDEYEDALVHVQKLLKERKDSKFLSLIYLKLARANIKLTHWNEARKYLNKIVIEYQNSPEFHIAKQLLKEKQFFAVQIGSFLDKERALKLVERIKQQDEYAYIVETVNDEGIEFYRVRVGKFSALDLALQMKQKLSKLGYPTRIYP